MSFYVYVIHNLLNNKIYVGKTKNLKRRWSSHLSFAKGNITNQYIHKAIRKYGSNNFVFSLIQELFNETECNKAEQYWINYFNSRNSKYGYNLTDGGDGSYGRQQTIATRLKISEAKTGTMIGKDNSFYGRTHTIETKNIISGKNTGLKRTDEFKKERSNSMLGKSNHFYGKNHTDETLYKISGENSSNVKLSVQQVLDILKISDQKLYSQKQIAAIYNISQQQVSRIVNGKKWKFITMRNK